MFGNFSSATAQTAAGNCPPYPDEWPPQAICEEYPCSDVQAAWGKNSDQCTKRKYNWLFFISQLINCSDLDCCLQHQCFFIVTTINFSF